MFAFWLNNMFYAFLHLPFLREFMIGLHCIERSVGSSYNTETIVKSQFIEFDQLDSLDFFNDTLCVQSFTFYHIKLLLRKQVVTPTRHKCCLHTM